MWCGVCRFSLLLVFLAKCLLVMQERSYLVMRMLYPTYLVLILGLGAACAVLSIDATQHDGDNAGFDQGVSRFSAITFGLLSVLIGCTGYKTHQMIMKFVLSKQRRQQVLGVSHVIVVYFVVFISRALWSVCYILNANVLQSGMNDLQTKDAMSYYWAVLAFYSMFEVSPIRGHLSRTTCGRVTHSLTLSCRSVVDRAP
eukprot:m.129888 g.129888  ORF g.129888 m.129888 type:complete len:199 (+) comp22351_c0_seq6:497-1093(+)